MKSMKLMGSVVALFGVASGFTATLATQASAEVRRQTSKERRAIRHLVGSQCRRQGRGCKATSIGVSTTNRRYALSGIRGNKAVKGVLMKRFKGRWHILMIRGRRLAACGVWRKKAPPRILQDFKVWGLKRGQKKPCWRPLKPRTREANPTKTYMSCGSVPTAGGSFGFSDPGDITYHQKPSDCLYSSDGSTAHTYNLESLTWKHWGQSKAVGSGLIVDNHDQDMNGFQRHPVHIVLFARRPVFNAPTKKHYRVLFYAKMRLSNLEFGTTDIIDLFRPGQPPYYY